MTMNQSSDIATIDLSIIEWLAADGSAARAAWLGDADSPPPKKVQLIDDTLSADTAYRLACEGTGLLWQGDFQNAKHLLQAITRRLDNSETTKKVKKRAAKNAHPAPADLFNAHRQRQGQRARVLNKLLIQFNADHSIPLRRAPDVREACSEARGAVAQPYVASLRELLGMIGAHEWRKSGVVVPSLSANGTGKIHAYYGVFSPLRGEYIDLIAQAPLPAGCKTAFDIGTGTGVLAAVLARRGIQTVVATDNSPRALACAADNLQQLGLAKRVDLVEANLFPNGLADLIVCNPPWLPARPTSVIEAAVYDHDSQMLKGFLAGVAAHLLPKGEAWLILSDLAEHLGLRSREQLLDWIHAAGLQVLGRMDAQPNHPKSQDVSDPLHAARAAETTTLWRLGALKASK